MQDLRIVFFISLTGCYDHPLTKGNCPSWARRGECQRNPGYMLVYCKKSCRVCGKLPLKI